MQFLPAVLFAAATISAVQGASLNSADRVKVTAVKSLLKSCGPKPASITYDQLCYSILGATRPGFKTTSTTLPVSSATETDTSTEMAPTPLTTVATSTQTVTFTSQSTSGEIVQRGQRFDNNALQAQFRAFAQYILNQACFEVVYGGVSPTTTVTAPASTKTTTTATTITVTPSTSTVTAVATSTTTVASQVDDFKLVQDQVDCENGDLNNARTSGDQGTYSGNRAECVNFCANTPGCSYSILVRGAYGDGDGFCYAYQNLPTSGLGSGDDTCNVYQLQS